MDAYSQEIIDQLSQGGRLPEPGLVVKKLDTVINPNGDPEETIWVAVVSGGTLYLIDPYRQDYATIDVGAFGLIQWLDTYDGKGKLLFRTHGMTAKLTLTEKIIGLPTNGIVNHMVRLDDIDLVPKPQATKALAPPQACCGVRSFWGGAASAFLVMIVAALVLRMLETRPIV